MFCKPSETKPIENRKTFHINESPNSYHISLHSFSPNSKLWGSLLETPGGTGIRGPARWHAALSWGPAHTAWGSLWQVGSGGAQLLEHTGLSGQGREVGVMGGIQEH